MAQSSWGGRGARRDPPPFGTSRARSGAPAGAGTGPRVPKMTQFPLSRSSGLKAGLGANPPRPEGSGGRRGRKRRRGGSGSSRSRFVPGHGSDKIHEPQIPGAPPADPPDFGDGIQEGTGPGGGDRGREEGSGPPGFPEQSAGARRCRAGPGLPPPGEQEESARSRNRGVCPKKERLLLGQNTPGMGTGSSKL